MIFPRRWANDRPDSDRAGAKSADTVRRVGRAPHPHGRMTDAVLVDSILANANAVALADAKRPNSCLVNAVALADIMLGNSVALADTKRPDSYLTNAVMLADIMSTNSVLGNSPSVASRNDKLSRITNWKGREIRVVVRHQHRPFGVNERRPVRVGLRRNIVSNDRILHNYLKNQPVPASAVSSGGTPDREGKNPNNRQRNNNFNELFHVLAYLSCFVVFLKSLGPQKPYLLIL